MVAPGACHDPVPQSLTCQGIARQNLPLSDPFRSNACHEIADVIDPPIERDQVRVVCSLTIPEAREIHHWRIAWVRGTQPYAPRVVRVRLQNNPRKSTAPFGLVNTIGVIELIASKLARYTEDKEIAVSL